MCTSLYINLCYGIDSILIYNVFRTQTKGTEEIKVAFKAHTREWHLEGTNLDYDLEDPDSQSVFSHSADITRRSIIDGFSNIKKEFSILSHLKHPHIIQLHGVMMRPLGLVLELAPKGDLKKILRDYSEAHANLHISAIKHVVIQVHTWQYATRGICPLIKIK